MSCFECKGKPLGRIIIMIAVAACLLSCTACGHLKITGVKSLAAANIAAQSKVDNYHMDGTVNMDITLDDGGLQDLLGSVDPKLPVKMAMDADAGTETAHMNTDVSASFFGKSIDLQQSELYMDMVNTIAYTKAGDSGEWKKSDYEGQQMGFRELIGGIANIGKTVLENATFSESDEYYSLTIPAKKAGDLIEDLHLHDSVDLGIADVHDITVQGGQIIYNVDKETLLLSSIELKDVDVRGKGTYEDISVGLKFPIDADFSFSRYNELEESEYAIPAEVIESVK